MGSPLGANVPPGAEIMGTDLAAAQPKVQFGGNGGSPATQAMGWMANPNHWTTKAFTALENSPMVDIGVRDVACYLIPQLAMARSWKEFFDILPVSLMLLGITIGGMKIVPPLLRRPVGWITQTAPKELSEKLTPELLQKLPLHNKLGRLAVAFGFLFPFAAGFVASPFARNWITLKRTGTANFEEIIGLKKGGSKKNERTPEEEAKYQTGMVKKILATGAALGAASLLGFAGLSRMVKTGQIKQLGPMAESLVKKLFNNFTLRGKASNDVAGTLSTMLFWLVPPYLGWVMAARSKNERIEQTVKGVNSVLWFSLFTPLFTKGRFIEKFKKAGVPMDIPEIGNKVLRNLSTDLPSYTAIQKLSEPLKEVATRIKNQYSWISFLVPVAMLSLTPQLLNIYFTRKRVEAQKENQPVSTPIDTQAQRIIAQLQQQGPLANRIRSAPAYPTYIAQPQPTPSSLSGMWPTANPSGVAASSSLPWEQANPFQPS